MIREPIASALLDLVGQCALAQVKPFPASFRIEEIASIGTTIHVRVGGNGPAVVLLRCRSSPSATTSR